MKLIKDICRQCHNLNRKKPWDEQPAKERTWKRGKIACVAMLDIGHKLRYLKTNQEPPYECYYRLEQLLRVKGKRFSGFSAFGCNMKV